MFIGRDIQLFKYTNFIYFITCILKLFNWNNIKKLFFGMESNDYNAHMIL